MFKNKGKDFKNTNIDQYAVSLCTRYSAQYPGSANNKDIPSIKAFTHIISQKVLYL